MPSQQVIEKLEKLQTELETVSVAIKHIEDASKVAKTASDILKKIPELLTELKSVEEKHRKDLQKDLKEKIDAIEKQLQSLLTELKDKAKLFVFNPYHDPAFAESPRNAVITLKNDRGTPYGTYLEVYDALKSAYKEIWEELAMTKYGKVWSDLSPTLQKKIKDEVPMVISEAEPTAFGEEM